MATNNKKSPMNRRVKTADEYLKEPYARILTPDAEGKGYTAEILEFLGCIAQGDTAEEAYTSLEETAREWIEAAVESGQEIPEPSTNIGYAGKVALRLPRSLHRQAVRMAERDGVSLNQFLVAAVAERVGATNLYARMLERLQPGVAQATLNVANNESNHLTMDAAIVNSSASAPPRRTRRR